MNKQIITACVAVAACAALAVPVASAKSPEATHPTGTRLAAGVKVQATNIGAVKFIVGTTTFECSTGLLTGTLNKNNGSGEAVEATVETASFTGTAGEGNCTSTWPTHFITNLGNGTPWCLKALAGDELQIRGNGCTKEERSITIVMRMTTAIGVVDCKWERTAAVKGTYKTDAGAEPTDAIGMIEPNANAEFAAEGGTNPPSCPTGPGKLEMKFTLETDKGATEPIWIS